MSAPLPRRMPGASLREERSGGDWFVSETPAWPRKDPDEGAVPSAGDVPSTSAVLMAVTGRSSTLTLCRHAGVGRAVVALQVAAHAPRLRVPQLLAYDELDENLSWIATSRLDGVAPDPDATENTPILAAAVARLHSLPPVLVEELPAYRPGMGTPVLGSGPGPVAAQRLDQALTGRGPSEHERCGLGFVHGNLSRNVVLSGAEAPGMGGFEHAGAGCTTEDLAALMLHEAILGPRDRATLLRAYETERSRLDPLSTPVCRQHLAYHLARCARLVAGWGRRGDRDYSGAIAEATPWLLDLLVGAVEVEGC